MGTPLLYNIPPEIVLMIGRACDVPTLRTLTRVSKPCRYLFCRLAYEEVRIDSNQQVLDKLESFTSDERSSAMIDVRDIIMLVFVPRKAFWEENTNELDALPS